MNKNKQSIRRNIIQKRKQLGKEQQQYSQKIAKHLYQHKYFINAKHIAYYLPIAGEADPTLLQQLTYKASHKQDKSFYLPIVAEQKDASLLFAKTYQNTRYKKNKYGIKEPIYHAQDLLVADKLDIVITPLVGFDLYGNRLGMGAGYYDRTFAFKQQSKANTQKNTPFLIGYAYDFQHVKKIPKEKWDIHLDGIVTESGMLVIK